MTNTKLYSQNSAGRLSCNSKTEWYVSKLDIVINIRRTISESFGNFDWNLISRRGCIEYLQNKHINSLKFIYSTLLSSEMFKEIVLGVVHCGV